MKIYINKPVCGWKLSGLVVVLDGTALVVDFIRLTFLFPMMAMNAMWDVSKFDLLFSSTTYDVSGNKKDETVN